MVVVNLVGVFFCFFFLCFQAAADYWLGKGVDGILLYGVERVANIAPSAWASIRETVKNHTTEEKKK